MPRAIPRWPIHSTRTRCCWPTISECSSDWKWCRKPSIRWPRRMSICCQRKRRMAGAQHVSAVVECVRVVVWGDGHRLIHYAWSLCKQRVTFPLFVRFFDFVATDKSVTELISKYLKEIEKLKVRLIESEQMYHQLKKSTASTRNTNKSIIPFGDTDGEQRLSISILIQLYPLVTTPAPMVISALCTFDYRCWRGHWYC